MVEDSDIMAAAKLPDVDPNDESELEENWDCIKLDK